MAKSGKRLNIIDTGLETFDVPAPKVSEERSVVTNPPVEVTAPVSVDQPAPSAETEVVAPRGYKITVGTRERKKRTVNLLTYGSLIDRIDAAAAKRNMSRTQLIEQVMLQFLEEDERQ